MGIIVLLVDERMRALGAVEAAMAVGSGTLVLPQMGLHVVHLGEALVDKQMAFHEYRQWH